MGKRKLIPLTTLLLCSLCLTAGCNKTSTTTNVATVGDNKITTNELYESVKSGKVTVEHVYNEVLKELIKSVAPATNSMKNKVDNDVKRWQNELKANSTLNKTDYDEDLKNALAGESVSSVDELIAKRVYELQYEYAKEKFLEAKKDEYVKAYIDSNYLYHASDITLSVSSSNENTDLYNLTLSSDEAKAIIDTLKELVKGEKYYNVASYYSKGDKASKGGDLGIINLNDTSITNELRYALIGYSSIIDGKYSEFNLPNNDYSLNLTNLYNGGAQTIPYSYIKGMGEVESTSSNGETKYYESTTAFYNSYNGDSLSTSRVYYRNIIFNNLLNTRLPRFITVSDEEVNNGAHVIDMEVLTPNTETEGYSTTKTTEHVLVNDEGNPYVVYKDSKGLHILSVHKTPFDDDTYKYYSDKEESDDYISYIEFGSDIDARKEEIKDLATRYITRSNTETDSENNFMSFALYKYYINNDKNGNFKVIDDDIKSLIDQYISAEIELADLKVTSTYNGYYDTYSNLIWFRGQDIVKKEIPLLVCLVKQNDDRYGCTYKYGEGFKKHGGSV